MGGQGKKTEVTGRNAGRSPRHWVEGRGKGVAGMAVEECLFCGLEYRGSKGRTFWRAHYY